MNDTLIELRDMSFSYTVERPVLRNVSFALRRGERVAILGGNGAGKTTVLRLMVGLLRPSSGSVHAFGRSRSSEGDFMDVRKRAGLLFQDPEDQLFCPTVVEDVAFGPLNLGKTRDEALRIVSDTLDMLELRGFENRITYELSSGEQRLVSLAAVLAMQPDVLLLDEPTTGLDEAATRRVENLVAELPQSMVIVSHDQRLLRRAATRAVRLHQGQIEQASVNNGAEAKERSQT